MVFMDRIPNPRSRTRSALIGGMLLVGVAILFVDRAASTWSHNHLHHAAVLDWLTHLVDPLRPAAVMCLAGMGIASVFGGRQLGERGRTLASACLAILVSVEIKEQLKQLFGRSWPETWVNDNPSWIGDHVYAFNFLHGGPGWESFPSGHTTQIAALAAVIWLRIPQIRWLGVALCALVALGLWGSDYHFVGDILAGALLGAVCGIGMVALVCSP
jgi:membrane-associated phospholipid phosphatase